jgi:hypothetical protein
MVVMRSSIFWNKSSCGPLKVSVSEEHVTSIVGVEEYAKQETSMKQVASKVLQHAKTWDCGETEGT